MLNAYRQHAAERAALGIPPLPLDAKQTAELIELIKQPPSGEAAFLLELLTQRVPPGVDDAAKVKASFLAARGARRPGGGADLEGQGHRAARHDGRRLQRQAADRPARRRRRRGHRRRRPEEDAADVRLLPRRGAQGQGRQRARPGGDPVVGRRRVVHVAPRSGREDHRHRVQGARRDQHRRPVARRPMPGAGPTSRCTTWRC